MTIDKLVEYALSENIAVIVEQEEKLSNEGKQHCLESKYYV